jgi:hypothetical protein
MTIKLSVKSPSLSAPIPSAFTPYPLFQWYLQGNEILLGAVKIYSSSGGAQEKGKRG